MIFKRKIYNKLLDWKENAAGEKALMIEGARRIGKSTIVEEFAKAEYKSYAILLLKPSLLIAELHNCLIEQLSLANLKLVANKTIRLTHEQVEKTFTTLLCDKNSFYEYMTSDDVEVFLVRGNNAITKAKLIKYQIRALYGVGRFDLHNFVHSADEGLEHYLQFKCFFPEMNLDEYRGFADAATYEKDEDGDAFVAFRVNNTSDCFTDYYGIEHNYVYKRCDISVISYFKKSKK